MSTFITQVDSPDPDDYGRCTVLSWENKEGVNLYSLAFKAEGDYLFVQSCDPGNYINLNSPWTMQFHRDYLENIMEDGAHADWSDYDGDYHWRTKKLTNRRYEDSTTVIECSINPNSDPHNNFSLAMPKGMEDDCRAIFDAFDNGHPLPTRTIAGNKLSTQRPAARGSLPDLLLNPRQASRT